MKKRYKKMKQRVRRYKQNKCKKNDMAVFIFAIFAVLGLLFYYLGMNDQQELEVYNHRITLICTDGNGYFYSDAEEMRMRNLELETPFSYVLWGKETDQLQNRSLARLAETDIYIVEGSSSLLFPSSVILDGTVRKSCLISKDIAQALFGTDDATGLYITMGEMDYKVLGMLSDLGKSAVFLAEDLNTAALDRMNIQTSDDVTLSSLEQNLEWELGFKGTALDYRFMTILLGAAGFVFCLLLLLWLLLLLRSELRNYRKEYAKQAEYYRNGYRIDPLYIRGIGIRAAYIVGAFIILLFFLRFQVKIPEDLIPPKWSDFEFWERLMNDKLERMLNWISCEKRAPELLYLEKSVRAAVFLAFAYLCYFALRMINWGRNMRIR